MRSLALLSVFSRPVTFASDVSFQRNLSADPRAQQSPSGARALTPMEQLYLPHTQFANTSSVWPMCDPLESGSLTLGSDPNRSYFPPGRLPSRNTPTTGLTLEQVIQRHTLTFKGPYVTPSCLQMRLGGKARHGDIVEGMSRLAEQGVGELRGGKSVLFIKPKPETISQDALTPLKITMLDYTSCYNQTPGETYMKRLQSCTLVGLMHD